MTDKDFKTKIKTYSNTELLEQMDFMADGYYSDVVEVCLEELRCRLEATKWHYPSKGELPTENGKYLVDWRGEYGEHIDIDQWSNGGWLYIGEVVAWMQMPNPPKKEEATIKCCENCGHYKNNVCERTKTHPNKPEEWTCLDWKEEE